MITSLASRPCRGRDAQVLFSPDGQLLAVIGAGDGNDSIYLWAVGSRRMVATLTDPGGQDNAGVFAVAFSPDGTLAVGDGNGDVYLWNPGTRKNSATLTPPINVLEANPDFYSSMDVNGQVEGGGDPIGVNVAFSQNGQVLAAGVDFGYGTCVWNGTGTHRIASLTDPGGDNSQAPELALSPDGRRLAVVDSNGRTYLWRVG